MDQNLGAVSLDKSDVGALGVSVGKLSKREAQRDAIAGCIKAGGKNCKDWAAYENQCAAVAEPYKDGRSSAGSLHFRTGASAEDIQREVKDICSSENNGECRVIYAACSSQSFRGINYMYRSLSLTGRSSFLSRLRPGRALISLCDSAMSS